jgi:fatty acid desaturase
VKVFIPATRKELFKGNGGAWARATITAFVVVGLRIFSPLSLTEIFLLLILLFAVFDRAEN